jgi:hypothetical protein
MQHTVIQKQDNAYNINQSETQTPIPKSVTISVA